MKTAKQILFVFLFLFLCCLLGAGTLDRQQVNPFDRQFMFPYSQTLSVVSDVTQYLSLFTPALIALTAPSSDVLTIGCLYGGAVALSFGTRTLLKHTIERERPYRYFSDPPDPLPDDYNQSFPSGHTSMAFTGAAFTHALFASRYPDSPYRVPITGAGWTLAAATAVFRVVSGNHFVTDVLAGALIGSLFGFAVPYLASLHMSVGPTMIAFSIDL